jgi:hypothetical protein
MAAEKKENSWSVDGEAVELFSELEKVTLNDIESAPFRQVKDGVESTGRKYIASMKSPVSGRILDVQWIEYDSTSRKRRW